MTHSRLLPALAIAALATPGLAQETPVVVDLAALFVGFADGAMVAVNGPDPATIKRLGPGNFEGYVKDQRVATVVVTESAPCVFDIVATSEGKTFPVRLDVGQIETITFVEGGSMGLDPALKPYQVQLAGGDAIAGRLKPDGTVEPLSNNPQIATSVPLADLQAGAKQLQDLCPTR